MKVQSVIISGKQGSGKTTTQNELVKVWQRQPGGRAITINFADVLYEMHDLVLNVLNQYWPDRGLKKDGPLLQVLGTEWGRNTVDQDIWVKIVKEKIIQLTIQNKHYENLLFIIGDCRFTNEFDLFDEALRVRLECHEAIRKQRCSMWRENTQHPSEIGLDGYVGKFDLVFNTGDEMMRTSDIVELINAQLQKNVWKEKRT